jgi:hypothetical protein
VFPLRGKEPRVKHGVLEATLDHHQIHAWWSQWPDANIGVRCLACTVLDVDPRHGGDVGLAELVRVHGRLPEGPVSRTGGGGWHILLRPLELAEGESLVRHPWRGADLCSGGHYVVAPPSVHPDPPHRLYRWLRPPTLELPEAPQWLRALCVRRPAPRPAPVSHDRPEGGAGAEERYAEGALRSAIAECEQAPDGAKHSTLARNAWGLGGLVRSGLLDEDRVRAALQAAIWRPEARPSDVARSARTIDQQMRAAPARGVSR